ncbi:MAG TPA: DUF3800 domain-containing protein, partial [Nitrosopumilaceae archaeon]|nr:DUF3800 domain-containing protein [Nitrosopumilaceae archaeon]
MPNKVYFDESGNSGDNLLDKAQPVFTLASHDYTLAEAEEILKPLRELSNAGELHFKTIRKSANQRKALLGCFSNPLIKKERAFCFWTHKQFLVCVQITDKLLEKVFYERGYDIAKGEQNIAYANLLYALGTTGWPPDRFDELCASFLRWGRSGNVAEATGFYESLEKLDRKLKYTADFILINDIKSSKEYMAEISNGLGKYVFDVTLPCFTSHVFHWSGIYNEYIDAI